MSLKKEVNAKSQSTQGRRAKEKGTEEESASMKLVLQAGPEASSSQRKSSVKSVSQLDAARVSKSVAAAAHPDGLLIDQSSLWTTERVTSQVGGHVSQMSEVLEKMKSEYPATYRFMRYSWMRLPPSMRLNLITKSGDFQALAKDPEMAPFREWLERLNGHGSAENRARLQLRRELVSERLRLASVWQESDAKLAELRAEEDTLNVLLPDEQISPEDLAEFDAEEREEIKEIMDGFIWNDPEMQLMLSYMNDPRASIDPNGALSEMFSEPVSEVDLLRLAQQRDDINRLTLGFRNDIFAEMPELERKSLQELLRASSERHIIENTEAHRAQRALEEKASAQLARAQQQGLTESTEYKQRLEAFKRENALQFVPNIVAVRILLDASEKNVDNIMPNLKKLVEQVGLEEAERIASQKFEEHMDLLQLGSDRRINLGDGTDEAEDELATTEILDEITNADDEALEEALIPDYAEMVTREYPDRPRFSDLLPPAERQALLDQYKADLDALMEWKEPNATDPNLSDADRELLAAKSDADFHETAQKLFDMPDLSLREQGRQMVTQYMKKIAIDSGVLAPEDDTLNLGIQMLSKQLRQHLKSPESFIKAEDAAKLQTLVEVADHFASTPTHIPTPDGEASMPIGNPNKQFEDVKESLRFAKDAAMDANADLNAFEARLDHLFATAKKITQRMLDPATKPDIVKKLESKYASIYGDALPHPLEGVTSDDVMTQWSQQMREDIIMIEARTSVEREKEAARRMMHKQMEPITSVSQPELKPVEDPGIYQFSTEDIAVERPVEERIYLSSDAEVEEIFSAQNVGKYLTLSDRDLKRYLPEGFSARLTKQEFATTGTKALLIREQALEAIANLKAQLSNSFVVPKSSSSSKAASSSSLPSSSIEDANVAKPMLLHGYKGCGKSALLSEVVYWARRSGWLVVSVPDGALWLSSGVYVSKNFVDGTWDQPKLFVRLFGHLLNAHSDKLKQIPLKSKGVKIGKIQPTTLFDVVEYGSVLEQYAAQCFHVFKTEIRKVVEFPVLLAFDSYNALYNPSIGFKDPESTSYYKDPLDPYNMSLGRLFYDAHLNHKLAHGTFIGALSDSIPVRRFIELSSTKERVAVANANNESAKKKNSAKNNSSIIGSTVGHNTPKYLEVTPYTMQEFTTVMEHYKHKRWVRTNMRPGSSSELYIYQLTSGFGDAIWSYSKRL